MPDDKGRSVARPARHPGTPAPREATRPEEVSRDGCTWRTGTAADVAWLQGRPDGTTVATAVPPVFKAYATVHHDEPLPVQQHEQALVEVLRTHTPPQRWWLGYLETGAHDVVFPQAPRVRVYWDWPYVLVLAGPEQALSWRTGHMRHGEGALPDLLFPQDRSWLVTALWDDTWMCVGGPERLVAALVRAPGLHGRRVEPDDDSLPPGLVRE